MQVVDLFAGSGGLSLGFTREGYWVAAAYDNWNSAVRCYQNNFEHSVFAFDLAADIEASISHIAKWRPRLVIGGPPCQDFSHAGKRKEGKNADLTVVFARIIEGLKPTYFVMENVDRFATSNAHEFAIQIFKSAGYGLTEEILNASYCGVPQRRKRYFCIGHLGAEDGFLHYTIQEHMGSKEMTVREYLGEELGLEYYYRHPRNYNRRGIYSIDEPSPTIRGVNRPVPKGYKGHPGDPVPVSPTLRPLTTMERARIQTYPKDFDWTGVSRTDIEQLIGNSVPVSLAQFVAKMLKIYLHNIDKGRRRSNG